MKLKPFVYREFKKNQMETVQQLQNKLESLDTSFKGKSSAFGYISQKGEPNTQYELLRRRIYTNTLEFWYYINSELSKFKKQTSELAPSVTKDFDDVLELAAEHKR